MPHNNVLLNQQLALAERSAITLHPMYWLALFTRSIMALSNYSAPHLR